MGYESRALDAVAEVEEHSEWESSPTIPGEEEFEASPDIPVDESDGFHLESVESLADVESLLNVESGKASAVIGLAESTIDSAIKTTGSSSMFSDELQEIAALNDELKDLTEGADTLALDEITDVSRIFDGSSIVDGVGVYETNSGISNTSQIAEGLGALPEYETVETIASNPPMSKEVVSSTFTENVADLGVQTPETISSVSLEQPLNVMGAEFQNLNESERFAVERASNITYYSSEKAQNPEELHNIVESLKEYSQKEFPDDDKFEASLAVIMADMEHRFADMPIVVENGAIDVVTSKKSNIEIIDDSKYIPRVERPTKEKLDEAHRVMMSTTRGRVMDMLAYMQDYEAVAQGKLESYQKGMPESRMRELKRKSWFSDLEAANTGGSVNPYKNRETVSGTNQMFEATPAGNAGQEIISGLTLTWESAADYYESIGNKAYAEFIRETGKFDLSELPTGDSVVGEMHLRLLNNSEYQDKFASLLRRLKPKSLVIVEHTSDYAKNGWTQISSEERFMQQAEKFAEDPANALELEVLDSSIEDPFSAWEESQMDELISEDDYSFFQGMKEASEKVIQPEGIENLVASIESDPNMTESSRTARLLGITRFINRLAQGGPQASVYIQQLMEAKAKLLELDSFCREVHYQNIIAQKKAQDPNRNVLVVVGNSHRPGIEQTLQESTYRTKVNTAKAQNLKQFIDTQKTN